MPSNRFTGYAVPNGQLESALVGMGHAMYAPVAGIKQLLASPEARQQMADEEEIMRRLYADKDYGTSATGGNIAGNAALAVGAGGAGAIPKTAALAGRGFNAAQIARAGAAPAMATATLEGAKPADSLGERAYNASVGALSSMGATALMPAAAAGLGPIMARMPFHAAATRAGVKGVAEAASNAGQTAAQSAYPAQSPSPPPSPPNRQSAADLIQQRKKLLDSF